MQKIALAVDVILSALVGKYREGIDDHINQAKSGEAEIVIFHDALCYALSAVREKDELDMEKFSELLRHSTVVESPEFTREHSSDWRPSVDEVEHWREIALKD